MTAMFYRVLAPGGGHPTREENFIEKKKPKMQGPFYGKKKTFKGELAYILGIWGETELYLWIWRVRENTFRELRNFLSVIWGDQCTIFRDQGSTDPTPEGLSNHGISLLCTNASKMFPCAL